MLLEATVGVRGFADMLCYWPAGSVWVPVRLELGKLLGLLDHLKASGTCAEAYMHVAGSSARARARA